MEKNKPEATIRVGQGIKATIWPNVGKNGPWFTVSISRTYEDKDGKLQDSSNFSRDQLPHVAFAAARAYQHMLEKANAN